MSDVTTELRSYVEPDDDTEDRGAIRELMCRGADEIERLRAAIAAIRTALDYDLRDQPDKVCDQRIWTANMEAHKIARDALSTSTPSGTEGK